MGNISCEEQGYISAYDMGLLYGFSLFETFYVEERGRVFLLDEHVERLWKSIEFFCIDTGFTKDYLQSQISRYIRNKKVEDKILRITITWGNPVKNVKPSVVFTVREYTCSPDKYAKGFRLTLAGTRRNETSIITRHKTSNYLDNYLAMQGAIRKGYDDALFLNTRNEAAETAKSNIFFVLKGRVFTPRVQCGILPGIIRGWVMQILGERNIVCEEGSYYIEDLLAADEIFTTNSVGGIMPVSTIDHHSIKSGSVGELTKMLQDEYVKRK